MGTTWREGDDVGGREVTNCPECGKTYYLWEGHMCDWKWTREAKRLNDSERTEPTTKFLDAAGISMSDLVDECNDAQDEYRACSKAHDAGFRWGLVAGAVIGAGVITIIRTVVEIWGS